MAPRKPKVVNVNLFEDDEGEPATVVEAPAPRTVPVLKPKPKPPKPHQPTREHENYDSGGDAGGSSDYMWAMEDSTTDTAKALEAFMGKGDLRKESELNEAQIRGASLLLEMAGRYKLPRIRNAVHHFLACRVSKDRGSRNEAVSAFTELVENRRMNQTDALANSLRREV
jgi:hypothetical protein